MNQHPFQYGHVPSPNQPPPFPPYQTSSLSGFGALPTPYALPAAGPAAFPASAQAQQPNAGGVIPGLGLALGLTGAQGQGQGQGQASGQGSSQASWNGLVGQMARGLPQPPPTQHIPIQPASFSASGASQQYSRNTTVARGSEAIAGPATNVASSSSNPNPQAAQPVDAMEEGELSDPNFDDLYEPDDPVEPAALANPPKKDLPPPASLRPVENTNSALQANGVQANALSVWNKAASLNAPSAFQMLAASRFQNLQPQQHLPQQYPPPQQPPQLQQYSQPQQHLQLQHQQPQMARDKKNTGGPVQSAPSNPYSSHQSSPKTINMPPANDRKAKKAARKKAKKRQSLLAEASKPVEKDKGRISNAKAAPTAPAPKPATQPNTTNTAASSGSTSLVEARRNAQAAVLNLLPLQVTVQTFVDEGIDEAVVRRVFSQLGIDPNASTSGKSNAEALVPPPTTVPPPLGPKSQMQASSAQTKAAAKTAKPAPAVDTPDARPVKTVPAAIKAPVTPAKPVVVMDKSGEERKDRIARLLAAKAAKGGATPTLGSAPSPSTPATPSVPTPTTAASAAITSPTVPAPVAKPVAGSKLSPDISKAPSGPKHSSVVAPQLATAAAAGAPAVMTKSSVTAKPSVTTKPSIATPTAPKAATPSTGSASKPAINKSDLLQQKLEALQKKREAEKKNPSALDTIASTTTPPVPSFNGHPFANGPFSASLDGSTMQLAQSEGAHHTLRSASTGGGVSSPPIPQQSQNIAGLNIPGLFMPATSPASLQRPSRKRPVAADFVSDSPPTPAKRPLIYQRDDKPLIIDVSDESDNEDIEMDLGSPADENTARRSSSLKDLPPLSGGGRSLPSPSPAGAAPNPQLALMNKQIEDMKRKIALAEARKKSKQSSRPVSAAATPTRSSKSPSAPLIAAATGAVEGSVMLGVNKIPLRRAHTMTGTGIPDGLPSAAPPPTSLVVPKGRTATPENGERRQSLRKTSESLPVVEASLHKKMSRLEQLRLEIAQLEDEVHEDTKEQERLKLVMEQSGSEDAEEGELTQQQPAHLGAGQSSEATGKFLDPIASFIADSIADTNGLDSIGAAAQATIKQSIEASSPGGLPEESNSIQPLGTSGSPLPAKLERSPSPEVASAEAPVDTQQDAAVATEHGDGPVEIAMAEAVDAMESRSSPATRQSPPSRPAAVQTSVEKEELSSGQVSEDASDDGAEQEDAPMDAVNAEQGAQGPSEDAATQDAATQEATAEAAPDAQVPISIPDKTPQGDADTKPSPSFVPYESPLKHFRSFRYHPEYKKNVPGGLRSLTYSNMIDVDRAICSQELLEGTCADRANCLYQHFDTMKMADDQILFQLGNNNDPFSDDEQVQYINGLRQLLASLRVSEVKDFNAITQAIIDYRSKFRGDPTRILPFGNVDL